jgi:hypothetical protein
MISQCARQSVDIGHQSLSVAVVVRRGERDGVSDSIQSYPHYRYRISVYSSVGRPAERFSTQVLRFANCRLLVSNTLVARNAQVHI